MLLATATTTATSSTRRMAARERTWVRRGTAALPSAAAVRDGRHWHTFRERRSRWHVDREVRGEHLQWTPDGRHVTLRRWTPRDARQLTRHLLDVPHDDSDDDDDDDDDTSSSDSGSSDSSGSDSGGSGEEEYQWCRGGAGAELVVRVESEDPWLCAYDLLGTTEGEMDGCAHGLGVVASK